jgi:transcription-repair coupling factor (superfamily II helicase)
MQLIQENHQLCQIKEKQTRSGLRLLLTFNQITSIQKAIKALSVFKELLPEQTQKEIAKT